MSDEKLKPWTTEPLRAKLDAQFTAALQNDPVCNGRVASVTIDYLVDQAIFAAEATGRHAARSIESLSPKGHSEASVDIDHEDLVEARKKLGALRRMCEDCGQPFYVEILDETLPIVARAYDALEAQALQIAVLSDPAAVHLNMLRGGIAKPSVPNIWHLYGEEALLAEAPEHIRTALSNSVSGVTS